MPIKMFESHPRKKPLGQVESIIAVAAGKGGVGKSTVAVNLALALKSAGYAVGVMDTDLYGPSVRNMLPEQVMPTQQGEVLTPAVCRGIKMMSMAYFRKKGEATAVRAPIANGLIQQFIKNVDWGYLDFLLIDYPPGTGDIQLTLSQQAPIHGAILVTTPQEVALMDVRKAAHLFEQVHIPIVGIVENMSYYQPALDVPKAYLFGRGGGEKLAQELGAPLLGEIPVDPHVAACGDSGASLFEAGGPAADAFLDLAQAFVAHVNAVKRQAGASLSSFELEWKEMS